MGLAVALQNRAIQGVWLLLCNLAARELQVNQRKYSVVSVVVVLAEGAKLGASKKSVHL